MRIQLQVRPAVDKGCMWAWQEAAPQQGSLLRSQRPIPRICAHIKQQRQLGQRTGLTEVDAQPRPTKQQHPTLSRQQLAAGLLAAAYILANTY